MNARLRTAVVSALIAVGLLVLVGATYQGVATALERRRYPHPGQLVDVGGHQLHLHCQGEGAPTVILEAPAARMSATWGWVQPEVAKVSRTCAYDRAGLGWSEAGDLPYDPGRVPEELQALLTATRQPGPFVLAGHSLGSAFVRRFAGLYPDDTAGLVLIDGPADVERSPRFLTLSPWLARAGVLRATGLLAAGWKGLPPASAGVVSAFLHRPDHLTRGSREMTRRDDAARLGEAARLPPSLPVSTVHGSLNDETEARRISAAIVDVVKAARGSSKPGPGMSQPR